LKRKKAKSVKKGPKEVPNRQPKRPVDDQHHIVPASRGGQTNAENLANVNADLHNQCYHRLFLNMTPDEIIIYLIDHWWNGQVGWLNQAQTKLELRKRGFK
jgi:hypothetical protein